MHTNTRCRWAVFCLVIVTALMAGQALAVSDLYIRDTTSDSGVEPYSGPGPIYLSPDIWVRNDPDPNHDPYPFPTLSPPWTPAGHQDPEYRNSKTGKPNFVYVRIHNRGNLPSLGTERLRLYQAKASTGLSWPAQWVDNVQPFCGADRLMGIEVTKPRKNAKSASTAERDAYRDALLEIQTVSQFQYSDGIQYWRKQNAIHAGAGNPEHGNPAFLSWHRELMNRYEEHLRESNPLVTLLYWDWQQDPRTGNNIFSTGATGLMGEANGVVGAPLVPLQPPTLSRNVAGTTSAFCPGFDTDASIVANGSYPTLATDIEQGPNHDCAHGYIGGYTGGGQISFLSTAAHDPFFFFLHANVDRLWAKWQRAGAVPARIDPVAAYGADSSNTDINSGMSPWDGATGMAPWTGAAAYSKTSKHQSVVYPPIYDDAPLNIPVLQPDETVILEIPWYPPNVNDYNCAGQAGHFCLLARIETATTAPFGMTVAEGTSVGANTTANNNIAWKNLTIIDDLDDPVGLRLTSGTTVRNFLKDEATFELVLYDRTEKRPYILPNYADLALALPDEILDRIDERELTDLRMERSRDTNARVLRVAGREPRLSLPMKAGETFTAEFVVDLRDREIGPELVAELFHFDLEQRLVQGLDRPEAPPEVGGVRFTFDFRKIQRNRDTEAEEARLPAVRMRLMPAERKLLEGERAEAIQHLSPGEPLRVEVLAQGLEAKERRKMRLEVDGQQFAEGSNELDEVLTFAEPGVHTIVTQSVGKDGEMKVFRSRVLVSENIPPNAVILSPKAGTHVRLGETVEVTVDTAAAFGRDVQKVSLYVKEGDEIVTGLNLVSSKAYQPIASAEGEGPHTFEFTPERPGMYMLQIGAVDDKGIVGVSGHEGIHVSR